MQALREAGCQATLVRLDKKLPLVLQEAQFDVAFPVAHGPVGEDGCLQGLLEVIGVPYVGSGVCGSAVAADKPTAKRCFRDAGLPVAEQCVVAATRDAAGAAADAVARLGGPLVVKPANGGSAIGVTRVLRTAADVELLPELETGLRNAWAMGSAALVERFHKGQEVTCGVLEIEETTIPLPPTLIRAKTNDWYDFAARYGDAGSEHLCPAPLPEGVYKQVQKLAVAAHQAVGARDLSRVDFVVGDSAIVLEVNTLPGMTATSNYPEAAAAAGISFSELCAHLVSRAVARPVRSQPEAVPWPD